VKAQLHRFSASGRAESSRTVPGRVRTWGSSTTEGYETTNGKPEQALWI
jgi:hypothetical protein